MKNHPKTYGYLRISTNTTKQSNSLNVQKGEIIKAGYDCDEFFTEQISGRSHPAKRKQLLKLLSIAKHSDKIIIHKNDRLSRDLMIAGWIKLEFKNKGIELISLESKGKDPTALLMDSIISAFAQFEVEKTRARINDTFDLKRSKNEALGGKYAPYGFDFDYKEKKKILKQNDKETKQIQEIIKLSKKFAWYCSEILTRIIS